MIPYDKHILFAKNLRELQMCLSDAVHNRSAPLMKMNKKDVKCYLKAYDAVVHLRSLMDDIMCDENPAHPNKDVFVYYKSYKALKEGAKK